MDNKELNEYFLKFNKIHPVALHKPELYKDNKLIIYQSLLLKNFNNKIIINDFYNGFLKQTQLLQEIKKNIIKSIIKITENMDRDIEHIINTYLEIRINELNNNLYEL